MVVRRLKGVGQRMSAVERGRSGSTLTVVATLTLATGAMLLTPAACAFTRSASPSQRPQAASASTLASSELRSELREEARLLHQSLLEDLTSHVPLEGLAGQLVMAGMVGTQPAPDLLQRVRQGEIGGIILFPENVDATLPAAIQQLQQAAHEGGNPPLLIATDQEGGSVRRLPGPPDSPRSITTPEEAARQGEAAGALLAQHHVNVDLAPVGDVTRSMGSFEVRQGRGFAGGAGEVAERSNAFAQGLQRQAVAATAKHFPGIGSLTASTDDTLGRVALSREQLEQDLAPFRRLVQGGVAIVMVANAVYAALDAEAPAVFSPAIVQGLLRDELGFGGVVISDDLASTPDMPGDSASRAVRAVRSGVDIVLYVPAGDGPVAYHAIMSAAQRGELSRHRLEEAYGRVMLLKRQIGQ